MPDYIIGDIVDSRYQLKQFLGGGRVGKVYLARDLKNNCDVAIKTLTQKPNLEREKTMFAREFAAVKNLNHPGVVKVYEQGIGYFTMEYVEGEPLSQKKNCDISLAFEIGIDITRVLEYIHRQGVIHRDLKPENIKINSAGEIKILDFGFAIGHEVANLISSGHYNIAGTLNYMAPEVIKGFQIDPRADLYSLGIILYELVTGHLPFKSSDILTTVLKQVETIPPSPRELNPKITPGFEMIIMKLIAKSPAKRFQSAEELLTAMMRLAGRSEILKIKIDRGRNFLYPPKFSGRDKELLQMLSAFKKAMKGRGTFVLITGDDGIGKKRLVQEFEARNTIEGTIFLDVRCDSSLSAPLAALAQIVYELFKFLEKAEEPFVSDLAARWGYILLPIVPALTHKSYMFGITPGDNISDEKVQQTLCQFFVEISKKHPLGIFIDDLHWIDSESAILLLNLVQSSQDHPIFLCGTYRGGYKSGENRFERILQRLKVKKLCEEISLGSLSIEELSSLVSSMIAAEKIPDEVLGRIYEVSRGIPLLAEDTMKIMADDGLVYRKGGIWLIDIDDLRKIHRPNLLEDSLIEKYEKLDPKQMQIVQTASVIGHRFPISLLESVSGISESDIHMVLPVLALQGFLTEMSEGIKMEIVIGSPRLAELIYEKIPPKVRQALHEDIAKELEKLPSSEQKVAELAHHYWCSTHKKKALPYLIASGDICEKQYAYKEAIQHYEKALEVAQQKSLSEHIVHLLTKLGNIYSLNGQYDMSLDYYQKGLELTQNAPDQQDLFHKGIGIVCLNKGEFEKSKKHFEILINSLRLQNKNIVDELVLISSLHIARGTYEDARKLLKEALDTIRDEKNKKSQASIYNSFAEVEFMTGHWANAISYYLRAFDILRHSEDQRLKAQIATGIARIYIHQGRTQEAYKYLEDALYFCHLTGDREQRVMVELEFGALFESQAHITQAKDIYQESLELAQDLDMKLGQAQAYLHLGKIGNLYEKSQEVMDYLRQSIEIFQKLQIKWGVAECYIGLGETYKTQGEYDSGLESLQNAKELLKEIGMTWKLIPVYTGVAEIYIKTGKIERANKVLNKALLLAKQYDNDVMLGKIHTQYGLFCTASGLNNEAREHFTSAKVFLERTNSLLEIARSYYEYGQALYEFEKGGDYGFLKGAIHLLEKAKDIYTKAGLESLLNKTTLLLNECKREKSDNFYPQDVTAKLREFSREVSEFESEGLKQLENLKKTLLQETGNDMSPEMLETMQKKIAEIETSFNKRLEELRTQNNTLFSQVEGLKAERESLLTLQKISNTINSVLDSQRLLNLIMDMVIKELRAERGFLVLKEGEEGLVFKTARNIDQEELSQEEFLLSRTIVKKVLKTGEPVLTSDAQADARFQSESIMDLKLRSILCVPFKIKERVIGAVYLDNRFVSGLFTEKDLDFLVSFSNQAAIAIENAFLYEELREKERMEQEIGIAARIQSGLLPKSLPEVPGIEVYGKMMPARQVGGDYYDFIISPDNAKLSLVIGDVSGKGIPAGLVMVMARLILHHFLRDTKATTKETMLAANRLLKDNTEPFIFMSMLLACWDSTINKFVYTGGGHENLIICRKEGGIDVIPAGGVVLGIKDNIESFLEEKELAIATGDCIILYTDGVTECLSPSEDMLEMDGFLEIIRKHLGKPPKETVLSLIDELKVYMGDKEQHDDITIMAIKKL